ncbi:MAG: sugar phosphate nucleotidyltransferase [Candidatus Gracilibacteria bacterium]|jgi:glucose-1-phosphate thymidylyltransferase|nr:sugar phosphate nucleotidyltransferase [Candidatus Gracilibacteria bacterium]
MIKKGVILAGGTGTRLYPATKITNKHLLPIYNRPMIYYPIETLKRAGIEEVLIICGDEHAGDFTRLLQDGDEFGMHFTYRVQVGSGGIAQALSLAENFACNENIAVILGDNIYEDDFSDIISDFEQGAHIFLKKVHDPERFGVAELDKNKKVINIEEKPLKAKTNYAATGLYLYDKTVFDKIKKCKPSTRGELEITDVSNMYINSSEMTASFCQGEWTDAGTHESFFRASSIARDLILKNEI